MKWPKMRKISFNSGYCWFVTSMVYYGLGLDVKELLCIIYTLLTFQKVGACKFIAARLTEIELFEYSTSLSCGGTKKILIDSGSYY